MNSTVSLVSAVVAVSGAVLTAVLGAVFEHRRRRGDREYERRGLASRYSDPLLRAAAALHARVGWFLAWLDGKETAAERDGDASILPLGERGEDYALFESLFRFANYLGCVEIMLQEVHFLDLGSRKRNKRLAELLAGVQVALSYDGDDLGPVFQLRGGEQRAIGETVIERPEAGEGRPRCLTYIAFRAKWDDEPGFRRWLQPVLEDIKRTIVEPAAVKGRLRRLDHALSDLIDFLDPKHVLLPFSHERVSS
ncbi:hypothetical protein EV193_11874 [Herbihabitans rhizosphaerae]|uniref:Uncharacterized protein n=1 Tax=Herbihabitans rhizosphaerae TaxID=1872711 RepID=A0A4Q7KEZ7_9PSEU|nr:hypothetical protein [Herbihabitans rhizosphaerae]RZS29820.1 hypothetical protein EV193_11874 [Herbihabitans rhizosphaerae]